MTLVGKQRKCGSLACGCWLKPGDCESLKPKLNIDMGDARYKELREMIRIMDERLKKIEPKEPCKHEPHYRRWNYNCTKPEGYDYGYDDECKHCGAKIKAVGWTEV